jgi:predicted DNA-binding transcriptional regulator AlpA
MNPTLKSLPDNAYLGIKEIASYTGLKLNTLKKRYQRGTLPPAERLIGRFNNSRQSINLWSAKFVRDNVELFS